MAKILKDTEMAEIISKAVNDNEIDDRDSYMHFLEDLAELICDHFGGTHNEPFYNPDEPGLQFGCAFNVNECVPDDGGIFRMYDKDVDWKNGKEVEPARKRRLKNDKA
jgi:hypothetical protein